MVSRSGIPWVVVVLCVAFGCNSGGGGTGTPPTARPTVQDLLLERLAKNEDGDVRAAVKSLVVQDQGFEVNAEDQVTKIAFGNRALSDEGLKSFAQFPHLRELDLSSNFLRADLSPLSGLAQLESLNLVNNVVLEDVSLAHLGTLANMKELIVAATPIGDAGTEVLSKLSRLETLEIDQTEVGDGTLAQLKGLANLKRLSIGFTTITDAGLANLANLTNLEELMFSQAKITNEGVKHLAGLTKMRFLVLNSTKIDDGALEYLTDMKQLQKLHLFRTRVTDKGMELISGLTEIKQLDLRSTEVSEDRQDALEERGIELLGRRGRG